MSYTPPEDDSAPIYQSECDDCEHRLVGDPVMCWRHIEDWTQFKADTAEWLATHDPVDPYKYGKSWFDGLCD
jgi:hypothetical protein